MIQIVKVKDRDEGNLRAHEILQKVVDSRTLLALSGGTSPDYRVMLATTEGTENATTEGTELGYESTKESVIPGAVCVVDERWGVRKHSDSNEYLMEKAGLVEYLKSRKIGFHNIQWHGDFASDVCDYDGFVRKLFEKFPKKVGVMGIGTNLHTAGIFPNSAAVHSPNYVVGVEVDDKFPKRITMTLKALGEFDNFIILAFGGEKRAALLRLFNEGEGDMQSYPAIFYRKAKIKSYLITDQSF